MNINPKNDLSFQKALKEILKGVIPFTSITIETSKLDLPQVKLVQGLIDQKLKGPRKKGVWVSVEKFTDLRIQWFWAHCFPEDHEEGAAEAARQAYCAVRDTPEAQSFLAKNEASFERLHHALCDAAMSALHGKKSKESAV